MSSKEYPGRIWKNGLVKSIPTHNLKKFKQSFSIPLSLFLNELSVEQQVCCSEDFRCRNYAAMRSRLATPFQCKLERTEPFINFGSNFKISFDSLQIRQVPFDMEAMRVPFALYFICSISSVIFVFVKYSPTRRVSAISKILSKVSLLISTNQNQENSF